MNIFTKDKLDYYKLNKDVKRFRLYPNKAKQKRQGLFIETRGQTED